MEKIVCPICSSRNTIYWFKKNNYNLYKCKNCDLGFVNDYNLENKIYDNNYFCNEAKKTGFGYTDYERDKEPMKNIFLSYIKKIKKLSKGKNIFDVGCATGYFLDLARSNGWLTSGVEISKYAAKKAKDKGHDVICADSTKSVYKNFDAVTMWDVLEHLPDPCNYIRSLNGLVESGSILLINTVDISSLWAKMFQKKWHAIIPPEHLFFFSPKSLKILLEKNNYEIIDMRKLGKKFTVSYILKTLYAWQGLFVWKYLYNLCNNKRIGNLFIPINLRDNIIVLAKKR